MGIRWKRYEKEGKWVYEQHPFWCTGYTFVRVRLSITLLIHSVPFHALTYLRAVGSSHGSAGPVPASLGREPNAVQG